MSNYSRISASRNEGTGYTLSAECPECGTILYPSIYSSWGGRKQSRFNCFNCDEKVVLALVSVE